MTSAYYNYQVINPSIEPISNASIAILSRYPKECPKQFEGWYIVSLAKTDRNGEAKLFIPEQGLEEGMIVRIRRLGYIPQEFSASELEKLTTWSGQVRSIMVLDGFVSKKERNAKA